MLYSSLLLIGAATLAAAQNPFAAYPACAQPCLISLYTKSACKATVDPKCACGDADYISASTAVSLSSMQNANRNKN
jgi:CFEM domain